MNESLIFFLSWIGVAALITPICVKLCVKLNEKHDINSSFFIGLLCIVWPVTLVLIPFVLFIGLFYMIGSLISKLIK